MSVYGAEQKDSTTRYTDTVDEHQSCGRGLRISEKLKKVYNRTPPLPSFIPLGKRWTN